MNKFAKLAVAAVFSLIAPFVTALPSQAFDPGDIQKTVSVKTADGVAYGAGATVALIYLDSSGNRQLAGAADTNGSGEATLTVDGSLQYFGIAVAPSASDNVHALAFEAARSSGTDWAILEILSWTQSFEITLATAEVFITPILGSTGITPAPVGTGLTVWGTDHGDELYLPRTGRFGINLSEEEPGEAFVRINPNQPGYFAKEQGFTVAEGATAPLGGSEFSEASNSYLLRMVPSNVSGDLLSSANASINLPAGVSGQVRFIFASQSGAVLVPEEFDFAYDGHGTAQISADGSFEGYLHYLPDVDEEPVAYMPQVFLTGDASWPSFLGEAFWVDSNGNFADNPEMTGSQVTLDIAMPESSEINLVLNTVRKGTSTPDSASIEIRGVQDPGPWWGNLRTSNGIAAYVLPDGQYDVRVDPLSNARPMQKYSMGVTGSNVAISYCCELGEYSDEFGWDWGPVDLPDVSSGGEPARFKVSGSLNDDLRIVIAHPVTGEYLNPRDFNIYVLRWMTPTQRLGDSQGVRDTGRGVLSVDLPALDSYYSASPLVLVVQPISATLDPLLVKQEYVIAINPDDFSISLAKSGEASLSPIASSSDSDSDTYQVELAYANVYGNLVDSDGNEVGNNWENMSYVFGNVQRLVADQNRWEYFQDSGVQVRDNGSFGLSLPNGTYRITFTPQGHDVAETITPQFTIDASNPEKVFNNFVMAAPLFAIRVVAPASNSPLANAQIEIRSDELQVYRWIGTGQRAQANLNIAAGSYQLRVQPPYDFRSLLARKIYNLVVTEPTPGNFEVEIGDGVSSVSSTVINGVDVFTLELALPNLKGRVLDPDGNPVRFTQVMPVDPVTGWDLWELATDTDNDGNWSINLPAGTYDLYARAPWGSSELGNSVLFQGIQIDSSGNVVSSTLPNGANASSWDISLRPPTFTGVALDPITSEPMNNVEICLFGPSRGQCTQVDQNGRWALSAPAGFESFDGWELLVREFYNKKYSEARYRDSSAILAALGIGSYVAGDTYQNIELTLPLPNLQIRVMAGAAPVSNAWVNIDRPGMWLGGSNTDADGYAKFTVDQDTTFINARADIGNVPSLQGLFTGTVAEIDLAGANLANLVTATLSLEVPNLVLTVKSPDGSHTIPYSWIELFEADTNRWITSTNANQSGGAALRAPTSSSTVTYNLRVNPNGQSSAFARNSFEVNVQTNGTVSISNSGQVLSLVDGRYELRLANPNVTGRVEISSSGQAVRDSWVVPSDSITDWYLWEFGTNSDRQGNFSMNLQDGIYDLEANVPYYLTGLAKSAKCTIVVASGTMMIPNAECDAEGKVLLKLREPNLKFKLVKGDPTDPTPVPFANVGVRVGNYSVNTQADRNGVVSMFLDQAEMIEAAEKAMDQGWLRDSTISDGIQIPLSFWIDPPWGSDDIVRWDCETGEDEPLCNIPGLTGLENTSIDGDPDNGTWNVWSAPGDLGDVFFKTPNTKVKAFYPGGTQALKEGAWISIFRDRTEVWGTWREWVGGGNTNRQGEVAFNIPDNLLTATFSLEVNAPWYERSIYPNRMFSNLRLDTTTTPYSFTGAGSNFALPEKNLSLTVQDSSGKLSRWSWISVEKVFTQSDSIRYEWLGGAGTDERGRAALYIEPEANVLFKLTAHPGPGVEATRFSCFISANGSDLIAATWSPEASVQPCASFNTASMVITLSNGNVRGILANSVSAPVTGAIVLAESTDNSLVSAVSNARGEFFMDLDPSKTWKLKVLYVNSSDPDPYIQRRDMTPDAQSRDDVIDVNFSDPNIAVLEYGGSPLTNNRIVMYRTSEGNS